MSLDPLFVADCPYLEDGIFIDEIVDIDRERGRVAVRMPTHAGLPITNAQRVDSVKHPRHVNGGLMVHVTGIVGFVHAYYILDLRHADGWTGYGGRIKSARFSALASVEAPIDIVCCGRALRRGAKRVMVEYSFEFTQNSKTVYSSEQIAMFVLAS